MKKKKRTQEKSSHASEKDKNLLTRRGFIGTVAGMGAVGLLAGGAKKPKEKGTEMPIWSGISKAPVKRAPGGRRTSKNGQLNLIVIIADTFRADHLGCYGSTRIKTPYLDRAMRQYLMNTRDRKSEKDYFCAQSCIEAMNWHYFQNIRGKSPGKGPCLYDLKNDPKQAKNVIKEFPKTAKALRTKLQNHLKVDIPALRS